MKVFNRAISVAGNAVTINSIALNAVEYDGTNISRCSGATVPTDGSVGFAVGCIFAKTDGGVATAVYLNEGTTAVSDFNAIESAASSITGVTAGAGLTGGGTEGSVTLNVISESVLRGLTTIATTGSTTTYIMVSEAGTLSSVDFTAVEALTAHDSNYVTFTLTNLGQAGSGSTVMLAATDANTTKATGGTSLVAKGKRAMTVTATGADLTVAQGDVLEFVIAATGTLANTLTLGAVLTRFVGTS